MDSFKPPAELSFTAPNLSDNWMKWRQRFDYFMEASEKNGKSDRVKIAILLNIIGDEGVNVFNTFQYAEGESKEKFKDVLQKFDSYCSPQCNEVFERFKFFSCSQKEGQAIDCYLTELKTLASTCGFEGQESKILRDRVVLGVRDKGLQERLLRESDLTLKKAIDSIRACEVSREQMKTINDPRTTEVNTVLPRTGKANYRQRNIDCNSCGRKHPRGQCPAYGRLCNVCKKKNHFAVVCNSRVSNARKGPSEN